MKKAAILILCNLILPLWLVAQQVEDYVVVDGKGHFVRADLLYRYLAKMSQKQLLDDYVNNFCVPYWPDYTRYWEIKDKWLYLVKIETDDKKVEYPLDLLFPDYDGSPVKATWFSGIMSYRSGDSPVIQLNREYYQEEEVVRMIDGKVAERSRVDHRERWISYAMRLMDKFRPLEGDSPGFPVGGPNYEGDMVEFLENAFSVVTHPEEEPSVYFPIIQVEFNADLEDLQLTEAHKELTSYNLLEAIARETQTVLGVAVSNQVVIFEIKENESAKSESPTPGDTDPDEGGTPSE
jgi:hypothetical protein